MPERVQLRRTKGYKKPKGAIVVTRPGPWGNPFTVEQAQEVWFNYRATEEEARAYVVAAFRDWLYKGDLSEWWFSYGAAQWELMRAHLDELYGRDLACFCPLGQPCHADVLLAAANGYEPSTKAATE